MVSVLSAAILPHLRPIHKLRSLRPTGRADETVLTLRSATN